MSGPPSRRSTRLHDIIIEAGLIIILVFTPLARGTVKLWSITPVEIITLLIFCVWLSKLNHIKRTPLDLPIFLSVTLAIVSTVFSVYRHDSLLELYRWLTLVAVYYIVANNVNTRQKIMRLVAVIMGVGAFISFFGLIQYLGGIPHPYWYPPNFLASTYVNHNHFAGYLEMCMPLAMGLLFANIEKDRKVLIGFLAILMLIAFVFSMSRGAWISFSLSLLVMGILISSKKLLRKRIWIPIFCAVIIAFILTQFNIEPVIGRARTITGGAGVDTMRLKIWQGAVNLIKAYPLTGSGPGTFVHLLPKYQPVLPPNIRPVYAHNDYLHFTAELGLFVLPLIIWLIAVILSKGIGIYNNTQSSFKRAVALGATVGVISIMFHSFVDFNLHITANAVLFSVLAGIIMALKTSKNGDEAANFC